MVRNNNQSLQLHFNAFIMECEFSLRLSNETIRGYREVYNLFIAIMPEVTDTALLTAQILIEFFRRLQERERKVGNRIIHTGVKDSTIKTYRAKLNVFFSWLVSKSHLSKNPLNELKPPKTYFEDSKLLSSDDLRRLYTAILQYSQSTYALRRDTAMLSLLIYTGVRKSEFLNLEIRDIDLEKRIISIQSTTSKSRKVRYIPVHSLLFVHLKDYLEERKKRKYITPNLITSSLRDTPLSRHGLKQWVTTLERKSDVDFHLHQFRHVFACRLASGNVHPIKIQRLLGHSNLLMTMSYLRSIGLEDVRDDIEKLIV